MNRLLYISKAILCKEAVDFKATTKAVTKTRSQALKDVSKSSKEFKPSKKKKSGLLPNISYNTENPVDRLFVGAIGA